MCREEFIQTEHQFVFYVTQEARQVRKALQEAIDVGEISGACW